jgi:hypothetical protein
VTSVPKGPEGGEARDACREIRNDMGCIHHISWGPPTPRVACLLRPLTTSFHTTMIRKILSPSRKCCCSRRALYIRVKRSEFFFSRFDLSSSRFRISFYIYHYLKTSSVCRSTPCCRLTKDPSTNPYTMIIAAGVSQGQGKSFDKTVYMIYIGL